MAGDLLIGFRNGSRDEADAPGPVTPVTADRRSYRRHATPEGTLEIETIARGKDRIRLDYDAIVQQVACENETGYLPPSKTKIERNTAR